MCALVSATDVVCPSSGRDSVGSAQPLDHVLPRPRLLPGDTDHILDMIVIHHPYFVLAIAPLRAGVARAEALCFVRRRWGGGATDWGSRRR